MICRKIEIFIGMRKISKNQRNLKSFMVFNCFWCFAMIIFVFSVCLSYVLLLSSFGRSLSLDLLPIVKKSIGDD